MQVSAPFKIQRLKRKLTPVLVVFYLWQGMYYMQEGGKKVHNLGKKVCKYLNSNEQLASVQWDHFLSSGHSFKFK